ncbi:hypothetical protein LXL04_011786 [Taraxacum kok-saghyz]
MPYNIHIKRLSDDISTHSSTHPPTKSEKGCRSTICGDHGAASIPMDAARKSRKPWPISKVTVWGICNKKEVLSTIRAKRQGARFWEKQEGINGAEVQSHTAPSSPQPHLFASSGAWTWTYIFLYKLEAA